MGLLGSEMYDLIGAILGLVLTLIIFSYIFGDNPLFRLAIHIFIGASAGYAAIMVWYNIIFPLLLVPWVNVGQTNLVSLIISTILVLLLLLKIFPRYAIWGNIPVAFMVGVGAAAIVGGAVVGTLLPQISATINLFDQDFVQQSESGIWVQLANSSIILVGALATLISFQFSARFRRGKSPGRSSLVEAISWVGKLFISITFGTLFAGIYLAALSALVGRLSFITNFIINFKP